MRKGKHHTEETKEKNRLAHLGKKHSEETKKKLSEAWDYDKHVTKEMRRKLSIINKGKTISKEDRRKMSIAKEGKYFGEDNPFYGKKHTEESRNKISKSHIGIQAKEKHHNWQGGISFEPYGIEFNNQLKEFIRKRDNYKCQECGFNQKQLKRKLFIHHIDFNKNNNNPNNLISLCNSCHSQTNFNRESWINYFQDKIMEIK